MFTLPLLKNVLIEDTDIFSGRRFRPLMPKFNVLVVAILLAAPAAAQRRPPVQEGARVRFELRAPPSTWQGIVARSTPDSLVVRYPSGELFNVSLTELERLQVRTGTLSYAAVGAVSFALGGIAVGLLFKSEFIDPVCSSVAVKCESDRGLLVQFGLVSAIFGGFIGYAVKHERWVSVPLDFRLP